MAEKNISKIYKDNFSSCSDIIDRPKIIVPISPTLNIATGGGIPSGDLVVITGKPKLGKTTFCLYFASKAQAEGFKVYYFNIENRLTTRDIMSIPGLDISQNKFEVIESKKGKFLNAEDYIKILLHKMETEEKCLFIMDSVSQLCSASRHANETGESFRDNVPIMLSDLTKKASDRLSINQNILICITHIIANTSGKGMSPYSESSGNKIQYAANLKLRVTHASDHKVDEKQVGQIMHWVCDTSSLGPPGAKVDSLLRYGYGIDEYYDLLQMCLDLGLVGKSGSWISIGDNKVQGMEKGSIFLRENPDIYKELSDKFKELVS